MTTVVGLVDGGKVYMAADRRITNGWQYEDGAEKITRRGEMLIGYAGIVRGAQIVRYMFDIPEHPEDVGAERYFVAHFIPALRQAFKDEAYAAVESNQETHDSGFLVGYRGALYDIESNYAVLKGHRGLCAIGSGSEYALGALSVTENVDARVRIEKAVRAGISFDAASGGDVQIEVLE